MKIENRIKTLLMNVGIDPALLGFDYLVEAVKMSYENKEELRHITTKLYPNVAVKFNTTPTRVERAMRHAITMSSQYNTQNFEILHFMGSPERGCLTNSQFIGACVEYLKIHEE